MPVKIPLIQQHWKFCWTYMNYNRTLMIFPLSICTFNPIQEEENATSMKVSTKHTILADMTTYEVIYHTGLYN